MNTYTDKLVNKIELNSPLVETTPFVFKGRLYLLENWRKMWDYPIELDNYPKNVKTKYLEADLARIRDVETDKIISIPLVGYGFCSAFVDGDRVYILGSKFNHNKVWNSKQIWLTCSEDLSLWSHPQCVLEANPDESFFNINVCKSLDNNGYILLVETDDPKWVKFTFRFFKSDDMLNWQAIDDGIYGKEKYVGGPAIYNTGGYYYVSYLGEVAGGWITKLTRSKDLIQWEDAPEHKPLVAFNRQNRCHKLRGKEVSENNASDLELCEFEGTTHLYFTGGDQSVCGNLQSCEYQGTMRELFESFYM